MTNIIRTNIRASLVYLLAVFFPFIMYVKVIERPTYVVDWVHVEPVAYNFLSYYKGLFIIAVGMAMLAVLLYDLYKGSEWRTRIKISALKPFNIALGLMAVLIILSSLLSEYPKGTWLGQYLAGEGSLHWLAYLTVFFYTQVYVKKDDFEEIGKGLVIASFVITALGFMAYAGHSLFENQTFMKVISPPGLRILIEDDFAKRFSSVFGNPNYLGTYVAFMLPLMMLYPFKWMKRQAVYFIVNWNLFMLLSFSRSSAGLLAVCLAIVAGLLINIRDRSLPWKRVSALLVGFIVIFMGVGGLTGQSSVKDEIRQIKSMASPVRISQRITDIELNGLQVTFVIGEDRLTLNKDGKALTFRHNDQNQRIETVDDSGSYGFKNPDLSYVTFSMKDGKTVELVIGGNKFYIGNKAKSLAVFDIFGNEYTGEPIPAVGFKGYEYFASGRGFIWSRTLPLLKETMIVGHGADTLGMDFPQNDILGRIERSGGYLSATDKPHNLYLFIAHAYGGVSLMLFIVAMCVVALISVRYGIWTLPLLISVAAVFVFNDSGVHTSVLIWVGVGYVVGLAEKNENGVYYGNE